MSGKGGYLYANRLLQRNHVAVPNHIWSADITQLAVGPANGKYTTFVYIFLVIDLGTRKIIEFLVSTNRVHSPNIVRALKSLLLKRNILDKEDEQERLIFHTDRDTVFSSAILYKFYKENEKRIVPSMSDYAKPRDNAVSERVNRTIKNLKSNELYKQFGAYTLNEFCSQTNTRLNGNRYRKAVKIVIEDYNQRHCHSTIGTQPNVIEEANLISGEEIVKPQTLAARNNGSSPREHREAISRFQYELLEKRKQFLEEQNQTNSSTQNNLQVMQIKKAIRKTGQQLAILSQSQFVSQSSDLSEISAKVDEISNKIDDFAKNNKNKKDKVVHLPLRDPAVFPIYKALVDFEVNITRTNIAVPWIRNKIALVLLFITGARISDLRFITLDDIEHGKKHGFFFLRETKTRQKRKCVLVPEHIKELDDIEEEIDYYFKSKGYKFLGQSRYRNTNIETVMSSTSWTEAINTMIKKRCEQQNIVGNFTSHSFRIALVTRALSTSDIEQARQIIGHRRTETTAKYLRFKHSTQQNQATIQKALEKEKLLPIPTSKQNTHLALINEELVWVDQFGSTIEERRNKQRRAKN